MLELLYTSTQTIDLGTGFSKVIYLASWDAVLYQSFSPLTMADFRKVFKDGTAYEMGQISSFGGAFHSAHGGRGAASYSESGAVNLALLDEISGLPMLDQPLTGVDMTGKVATGSYIDHVSGLVYTPDIGSAIKVYSLSTGTLVRTLDASGLSFSVNNYILHDAGASMLFVAKPGSGNVAVIDRLTGAVICQGVINAGNKGAAYDTIHRVVLAILNTGQVAVYAPHNVGYALSAPLFSPSPALYTLSRVTTRLTSEDGQGVAGKGVLWWLTGDKGYLEKPVTLTDEDGYARNWYYGPAGDYGLGEDTVNVEALV